MRPVTPFNRFYQKAFYPPFRKIELACASSVQGELIGSLELYSEVKAFGKDLLRANGHTNISDAFLQFQAYIRQARAFFEAAQVLHHRASPLNYYYAFMNFAKAYILLRTPGFVDRNLVHGLRHTVNSNTLRKQDLKVQ